MANTEKKLAPNILLSNLNDTNIKLFSSTIVGATLAALFNPVDRALYLSHTSGRTFFLKDNFIKPFEGFRAAIFQRAISGGSYYFLQAEVETKLERFFINANESPSLFQKFSVGLIAGSLNGIFLNPLSAIKSNMWSESERIRTDEKGLNFMFPTTHHLENNKRVHNQVSFFKVSKKMFLEGGMTPFFRGLPAMVLREMAFGVPYEVTRYVFQIHLELPSLLSNSLAGGLGAIASSVPNYLRNQQYHTPPDTKARTLLETFSTLTKKVNTSKDKLFELQRILCIGPGTLRVALGSAIGQGLFNSVNKVLTKQTNAIKVENSSETQIRKRKETR